MNKTREQIIHSMCMTWQHDYGLLTEHERNVMFKRMAQIFDHEIASELMMQSDCDNYEEEAEEMRDKIDSLEQRNTELEQRVKELEEPKTCDGYEYLFTHTNQCMNDMGCERILSLGIYADYYKEKGDIL